MKAEAFRDDLASQRLGFIDTEACRLAAKVWGVMGDSLTFQSVPLTSLHPIGYTGGGTDREWRFTHTDGSRFYQADPAPGESYGAWAMKCAEEAESARAYWAAWDYLRLCRNEVAEAEPMCRESEIGTGIVLVEESRDGGATWPNWTVVGLPACDRESDRPGIAAMAAKAVQPQPEPVLSIGGQKTTEREITEALALLRGQNAPAVKETPRGLMIVREFDHRLGAWKG